nr:aminotransferase class I/II-fold pyridoxal phosphate-dependent enzyme [Gordonia sp. LAM0048]
MSVVITGQTVNAIVQSARDAIVSGRLRPGDTLPPIRELATELGVNRNTVATAYRQLVVLGAADTRGRGGTVVADRLHPGSELAAPADAVDLAGGNPDPDLLPDLRAAIAASPYRPTMYGTSAVAPALRAAAPVLFGDHPQEGELVATHGAVDAMERLLNTHLARGDGVAVENPCFLASVGTIRVNGYRALPVELDGSGMRPDHLARALDEGARAVIVTCRGHNPGGIALSETRAGELRTLLERYPEVLVIEDDHFSLLSVYDYRRVIPDNSRHWAVVRSVAKFLGPDLRVALVDADPTTAAALDARLRSGRPWVSHLLQTTAAHLLTDPATTELIATARDEYARRTGFLIDALTSAGVASTLGPPDGINTWVDLPREVPAETVSTELARRGWAVQPGTIFAVDSATPRNGLRVTTSRLDRAAAETFTAALAASIAEIDAP